ncbi:MAG: alanine--tRNA ligase [Acidobacteria bacterium]|nr:alanine--tRNA ligase [Acidobacteriota bacterium]
MRAADIRRTYLEFFRERGHRVVRSSSLVPTDPTDPLLTTAGMVQFKPFLLGKRAPEFRRAASCQKCARTTDIERVGRTARHQTVFEMLGNFSFGDYFKREACAWAWELVTGPFGLDPQRLWVTVLETDDEAAGVWRDAVGVPADRIVRRGPEDNFWWMGVAGPCGPCSEIFYDRGPAFGDVQGFVDGDRIMEIWNLVFTESVCDLRGTIVGALEARNIDTGMGLERMAQILQDVPTAYDTDVLRPVLSRAEAVAGRRYGTDPDADVSLRIMAEHGRTAAFLIGDGVFPSNEDRGYVLRRIIRRAVRHARILGVDRPVMADLAGAAADTMGEAYPELVQNRALIDQVAFQEEEHFRRTLRQGLVLLEEEVGGARRGGRSGLPGDVAFRLHDTYGFPLDLTVEIAGEAGLEVDRGEFARLMEEQQRRSREGRREGDGGTAEDAFREILAERGGTKFLGYERLEAEAPVVGIVRDGERVASAGPGDEIDLVLEATPFYAEGGGQLGDAGLIRCAGADLEVINTRRVLEDLIVHRARVASGEATAGAPARAMVDPARRAATERSHTATHLLHWALRDQVGAHARQAGSLVAAGRLRFDFNHFEPVPAEALARIEGMVNAHLAADDPVRAYETSMDEARRRGATALFGEKYGDIVRVVEIGDYSIELCGGTHVGRTAQVGLVKLLGEGSIGSGLRRVEALTGPEALEGFRRERFLLEAVAALLKVGTEEVPERVRRLVDRLKGYEEELRAIRARGRRERAKEMAASARPVGRASLVAAEVPGLSVGDLQQLAGSMREAIGGAAAVVLGSAVDGRAGIVAALGKDLVKAGGSAKRLIAEAARAIGGGAGGRDDMATGGGNRADGIPAALAAAEVAAAEMFT